MDRKILNKGSQTEVDDDMILIHGIKGLISESKTFRFLNNEDNLYSACDLKEIYK